MVVFEDYSEFENGKGIVKKVQQKKPVDVNHTSTPKKQNPKIKTEHEALVKQHKPKSEQPTHDNNNGKHQKPTRNNTPPVVDTTSKQSTIPSSLIPPKARRSGSVTPQPQFIAKPVVVEPCRILTVSGGIQIPTVTSSQMEEAKQIASKFLCLFFKGGLYRNGYTK